MKKRTVMSLLLALGMLGTAGVATACGAPVDDPAETPPIETPGNPEDPGTTPEDPGTTPEDPGTTPEDPGTTPEDPGTTPEDPVEQKKMIDGFKVVHGSFSADGDEAVKSVTSDSIAVNKEGEFRYGTLEAQVTLTGTLSDNGIVFALTEGTTSNYWESNGTSYYFFFISRSGTAYLGKVSAGTWFVCAEKAISGFSASGTYKLTVIRDDISIRCYVNDTQYLTFSDNTPLDGVKYGFRAGTSGVSYTDLKVESVDITEAEPSVDYTVISGKIVDTVNGVQAKQASVALHKTVTFSEGTFSLNMSPVNSGDNSVIFCADATAQNYYALTVTSSRYVELSKVVNGSKTVLQKGVLSAGYSTAGTYKLTVAKEGGEIRCYFNLTSAQAICYAAYTDASPLTGTGVGVITSGAGTYYSAFTVTEDVEFRTADTLLFGHSYMELWYNYKSDFPEYTSIDDIGIGGSIASHWNLMVDQVVSYQPKLGIYNIGINDLTGGVSAAAITENVENALLAIKEKLPEFEVVLISVNHCPARRTITAQISETNVLYRNLAASYDWIHYAEVEYAFNSDATDPSSSLSSYFTDNLHPTASGYDLIADAVRSALKGENQPTLDPEIVAEQLANAKKYRLESLGIYAENAYSSETWVQAKTYYDSAVAKINACTTKAEVNKLDLSEEITALKAFANKAATVTDNLLSNTTRIAYNASGWSKQSNGSINMNGYAYALDKTAVYTDSEVVFRIDNNTGVVSAGGILLRASINAATGIDGYLVNYVSDLNYMQIYYLKNVYNTNGSSMILTYLGGLVFTGEVVGTDFHVKIEGSKLYLSTLADYETRGTELAVVVDLSYNGQYAVYEQGYYGEIVWTNAVGYDLLLEYFAGTPVGSEDPTEPEVPETPEESETRENIAETVTENLVTSGNNVQWGTASTWAKKDADTLSVSGLGWALDTTKSYTDAELVFRMDNNSGVVGVGGFMFRANADPTAGGVDGYIINFVTDNNYIQIFYVDNGYNKTGAKEVFTYLGGLVSPVSVVGNDFYVKIVGNTLYLGTYADAQAGNALVAVDLTFGGTHAPYEYGYFGEVSFTEGVSFDLSLVSAYATEISEADVLAAEKAKAVARLSIYSQNAYRATEWEQAKTQYESAVAKINACTTRDALRTVDLSAELTALAAIKSNGAYTVDGLINSDTGWGFAKDGWTATDGGALKLTAFSYGLDTSVTYQDSEIVFRMDNNTGVVNIGGVFFRASASADHGINGYLINFSSESNFVQIWYCNNWLNTAGTDFTLTYLGGIVYDGEVENTDFYAKVQGGKIYVCTLAEHLKGDTSKQAVVDLTNGGQYALYESGYIGAVVWADGNQTFELALSTVAADVVPNIAVPEAEEQDLSSGKDE